LGRNESGVNALVVAARAVTAERPTVPAAELPKALQGYAPALSWHPETVKYWDALTSGQIEPITSGGRRSFYPVSREAFAEISIDVIRTLGGLTPWMRLPGNQIGYDETGGEESHAMLFAGKWIVPQLKVMTQEELDAISRESNGADALRVDRVAYLPPSAEG
jgi:hypothetical protein